MKLKRVEKIRDEYFDNNETLSQQSLDELRQHLEGKDEDQLCRAISLVTDARLMQFVPLMAKHLNHEDSYVRESLIGKLLGILKLPEYAEIGFKMAKEDKASNVRGLATFSLGEVLPYVEDPSLRHRIANYLYQNSLNWKNKDKKHSAYYSVLAALGVSPPDRPRFTARFGLPREVEAPKLKEFKKKYLSGAV